MCVCVRESFLCWLGEGKMGSNSSTLASHAVSQSHSGFPVRHGNAVIKPGCKTFAVQSTRAFWGLYLETRKEHFTVLSCRVESRLLISWLCFCSLKCGSVCRKRAHPGSLSDSRVKAPNRFCAAERKQSQLPFFVQFFQKDFSQTHPGKLKSLSGAFFSLARAQNWLPVFTRNLAPNSFSYESPRSLPEDDGGTRQVSL